MHDGRFQQDDAMFGMADGDLAHARRVRRRQRAIAIAIAFVVVTFVAVWAAQADIIGGGAPAAPRTTLTADATAVTVLRPKLAPIRVAQAHPVVGGVEHATEASAHYAIDPSGSLALIDRASSDAVVHADADRTSAVASAEHIELLAGRIVIDGAKLRATAHATSTRATSQLEWLPGATVTIDGRATIVKPNLQVAIQGVGTLVLNEQAVLAAAPTGDKQSGPRQRMVGAIAHLRITTTQDAAPAGTEVIVGRVDAGVRRGKITTTTPATGVTAPPTPSSLPAPTSGAINPFSPIAGAPKPGESTLPRRSASTHAGKVAAPTQSLQQYVFPVLGETNYSNDWGGPRASTGIPHQGTDVFAAEGTPIVAVADGVLDRVGWNTIGGYRFWLFDQFGNSFYHAHLSAYAPLAQDGAHVKAGDVIGFVGHTGDAQGTPSHLHFEVHPGNGEPTNPFPFLNAWRHGVAVAIGLLAGDGADAKRGASSLLSYSDISPNSGLQGSVLDTVPDTHARPVAEETAPKATDDTLRAAVSGNGISR
jgi:murein DD-endopeptidase MepM/ murein hydrolase activator NlpD